MKLTRRQLRKTIKESGRIGGKYKVKLGTSNYAVDCDNVGKTNACAKVVRYREKFRNLSGEKLDNLETTHSCPSQDLEDICAEELSDLKDEDDEKGANVKVMMSQVKQSLRVDPVQETMKLTRRQLRQIIKEEMGQLTVIARMRGQGDREAYASGIYEDDVSEDKSGKGECPDSGCITQRNDKWRIISNKTGKLWPQKYNTKKKAKNALDAYHASR
tara:strand:+ start:405 stop:1052 length:648 start_codon:yes stop_codon:yes gene_type:complete